MAFKSAVSIDIPAFIKIECHAILTIFCRYTTINKKIVLFNRLFDQLDAFQKSNPHLAEAIECCKDELSKYYSKTDLTSVYANSTLVDPGLKFSYW